MRLLAAVVVVVASCHIQEARAQNYCVCSPVPSNATVVPAGGTYYYSGLRPVANPPACAPAPVAPCTPVGGSYAGYAPYAAFRPVAAGPVPAPYYVGRGVLGQPTLYATGQPLRNFLRFLSP